MSQALTNFAELGLDHFSPSQLNKPLAVWMFQYVALTKEDRRQIKVGYPAIYGTAVHNGTQHYLCDGLVLEDAVEMALTSYDLQQVKDTDDERNTAYRDKIQPAIEQGIEALGDTFENAESERHVSLELPDVVLPIIGYVDFIKDNVLCEFKTKIGRMNQPKKDGTRSLGKAQIPDEPQQAHVEQVAIYSKATGAIPSIAYVSHDRAVRFDPFNCQALRADNIDKAIERVRQKALKRQNLIAYSNDPMVLGGILEADFSHPFYWDDPDNIEYAKEIFKV